MTWREALRYAVGASLGSVVGGLLWLLLVYAY